MYLQLLSLIILKVSQVKNFIYVYVEFDLNVISHARSCNQLFMLLSVVLISDTIMCRCHSPWSGGSRARLAVPCDSDTIPLPSPHIHYYNTTATTILPSLWYVYSVIYIVLTQDINIGRGLKHLSTGNTFIFYFPEIDLSVT